MPTSPTLYAQKEDDDPKPNQGEETDAKIVKEYWREIERYGRSVSAWHEDGRQIEQLYLEEDREGSTSVRRMAIFWANVETMKPAVYSKPPVVVCSRRYKDRDPAGRVAAELMERATNTMLELTHAHETFESVRDDRLLPGRGQAWVRYESKIGQYTVGGKDDEDDAGDEENSGGTTQKGEGGYDQGNGTSALPASPGKSASEAPEIAERLEKEYVCADYVHWTDFGHNVARVWKDVWLVWRCVYKTKEEVSDRFGQKIANAVKYNVKAPAAGYNSQTGNDADDDHCMIYEIWDKRRNLTSWITEGLKRQFMDSGEPPIEFPDFFPCPKPCYATKSTKRLVPRPDYAYYKDQVKEINDLTDKIHNLTGWLIVKGFVPGAPSRVTDAIDAAVRDSSNKELLMQVESWTEFTERGGISKLIDWLPIDMIVKALQAAITSRNQLIQDVFQITGISDILRGETDPNETLGAQTLKAQTGSRRISTTKGDVARFCRDIAYMMAVVIADKFEPENIAAITGFTYQPPAAILPMQRPGLPAPMPGPMPGAAPPLTGPGFPPGAGPGMPAQAAGMQPPPANAQQGAPPSPGGNVIPMPGLAPAMPGAAMPQEEAPPDQSLVFDDNVIKLLRDDRLRSFRIEVETDSTVQPDMDADQQRRTEFVTAVGGYLQQLASAMQISPQLGDIGGQLLLFAVRGFHVGRQMEETIEKSFEQMKMQAQQAAANPQPDPEQQKAEAQAQIAQQKAQQDGQMAQQKHEMDMQRLQAEFQIWQQKMQMEMEQMRQTFAIEQQKMQMEMEALQAKIGLEKMRGEQNLALKQREGDIQAQQMETQAAHDNEAMDRQAQHDEASMEREAEHGQAMASIKEKQAAKPAPKAKPQ